MIPKKIYLRKEELDEQFTCEGMVSCNAPTDSCNVEYTDLSQVWHDSTEIPDTCHDRILVLHKYPDEKPFIWAIDAFNWVVGHGGDWNEYVEANHIISWAYNMDLLPKGGKQ